MTVVVIGLGSMGKRRIRLLRKYDADINIVGVDSNKSRGQEVGIEFSIRVYSNLEEAFAKENADKVFICTSPLSHANIINLCLQKNKHVFTELNLVENLYKENIKLAEKKEKVLFLSSTFLYRKEIEYMNKRVREQGGQVNYTYHAGQYLPDWHPWENYKNFFVGQRQTNGCREFMAIEFPWIVEVFGKIKSFYVRADKMSGLELDYPDNYLIMLEHENGNKGMIALDVVSRKAVRNLEIFSENLYLKWDGTPEGLWEYDYDQKEDIAVRVYEKVDKLRDYSASIIEDAYYCEIENFFDVVAGKKGSRYSFSKDLVILDLINQIEKAGGISNEQK